MSTFTSLVGALWYLRVNSLVGRIRSRLQRLKQPKYLAGAVVGALYFYFVFFRRAHAPRYGGPGSPADSLPADLLPAIVTVAALVLLLVLAINWCFPRQATLAFSESEIAFLFPAPVSRRMLVHYRILGAQLGIFFTALIFTVVFRRGASGGHATFHFVGWWLVLALVNLHITGTSFVWSRLLNKSLTSTRRRTLILCTVAILVLALVGWIAASVRLPTRADVVDATTIAKYISEVFHAGPMPWLLALPKRVVAPYFATGLPEFALALIPALLLLAAHYVWVVHTEVSFEEASIARAEKRAARRRAIQQGDWRGNVSVAKARKPAFALGPSGRPELAFLWKNLLATGGFFRPRPVLLFAAAIVGVTSWISRHDDFAAANMVLTVVGLVILVMTVLLGPQIARMDLRTDLANSDILKTYPLRGWQIVLGEVATPVVILCVVFWLALLTVWLASSAEIFSRLPETARTGIALALAVLAPPFIAIQVLMPNAAAVLFPAWVQTTRDQTERGIEVMGQRMIFMASQLFITALVILPALIVGVLIFFLVNLFVGPAAGGVASVIAMTVLLGVEAWLGVHLLGGRFEQLDISSELRP